MPKIIGIDLGTTNSVAAIVEADKIDIRKMKNLKEFLTTLTKFILKQKNER
jgi:molecular chaperone DnaK (HSP70)